MSKTVELELDDLTYVLEYRYAPHRDGTRWEPPEGGVEIVRLLLILEGYQSPVEIDVTDRCDDLPITWQLEEMARDQEREIA